MVFEKIEKLAKEKGMTITSLEKKLGFGNGTIRGWKDSSPSLDNIVKVADFFGVAVDYFARRGKESGVDRNGENAAEN